MNDIQVLGMNLHYFIILFFTFSLFGYLLECLVLSIDNRKVILNRGFTHTPFCVIYGFGALGAYLFLEPFKENLILLYIFSLILATSMELVTAKIMFHFFDSLWWDYSMKKFNYKGVICLESSIGWGFLGIFFFYFLDNAMRFIVDAIPFYALHSIALFLIVFYFIDFLFCVYTRLHNAGNCTETNEKEIGRLTKYKGDDDNKD